jgi:hypothetical protein
MKLRRTLYHVTCSRLLLALLAVAFLLAAAPVMAQQIRIE